MKSPSITLLLTLFLSSTSFATIINLYDQPKNDGKIIGTVDSEKGIIPIFTPKDGQWVKIADPSNGNVGWAKASSLKVDSKNGYTFSAHTISQHGGPESYVIQFGVPKPLTDAQLKEYTKKMQERQQAIEKNMQSMMQSMFTQFNEMSTYFPVVIPVLMPEQNSKISTPSEVKNPSSHGKNDHK